jgi:hypothetical protein
MTEKKSDMSSARENQISAIILGGLSPKSLGFHIKRELIEEIVYCAAHAAKKILGKIAAKGSWERELTGNIWATRWNEKRAME